MRAVAPLFMRIKNSGLYPIKLDDKERYLLFSLDVIEEVENEIGNISELEKHMNAKGRMKFIKWLLVMLLNEGAKFKAYAETGSEDGAEILTERMVGMLIHIGNLKSVMDDIYSAFAIANKGTTEPPSGGGEINSEDENEGNKQAGRVE